MNKAIAPLVGILMALDSSGDVARDVPRAKALANLPGLDPTSGKVDKGTAYDTGEEQAGLRDTANDAAVAVSGGAREETTRAGRSAGVDFVGQAYQVSPIYDSTGATQHFDPDTGAFTASSVTAQTAISKVLRIPFAEFIPYDGAQSYRFNPGRLTRKPGDAVSNSRFMCPLLLPKGVTITLVSMRGLRANTNEITRLYLYQNDDSGTATVLAGPLTHTTTAWQTVSSSALSQLVGDQHYTLEVELDDATGASGDTAFAWSEVTYTMADYAKGI